MWHPLPMAMLKFDGLTIFGLIAVSLMLLFYALEARSAGCKARGHLAWWNPSGPPWPCAAGGQSPPAFGRSGDRRPRRSITAPRGLTNESLNAERPAPFD